MIYRHHPREVASGLNMREFTMLCTYLDNTYGPERPGRKQLIANGFHYFSNTLEVKAGRGQVKFNVLGIRRGKNSLFVHVDLGGGVIRNLDMSDVAAQKEESLT